MRERRLTFTKAEAQVGVTGCQPGATGVVPK